MLKLYGGGTFCLKIQDLLSAQPDLLRLYRQPLTYVRRHCLHEGWSRLPCRSTPLIEPSETILQLTKARRLHEDDTHAVIEIRTDSLQGLRELGPPDLVCLVKQPNKSKQVCQRNGWDSIVELR